MRLPKYLPVRAAPRPARGASRAVFGWHVACVLGRMDDSEAARRFVASLKLHGGSRRAADGRLVSRLQLLEGLLRRTCRAFEEVCAEQLRVRAELARLQARLDGLEARSSAPGATRRAAP